MPQKPTKGPKAKPLKLFVLDNEGTCVGECQLDEECVVDFSDFTAVVGDSPLADMQMFYLGEHSATVMHGKTMNLVVISRGRPGPDELSWSKAVLSAVEGHLVEEGKRPARHETNEEIRLAPPSVVPAPQPSGDLSACERKLARSEGELADAEEKIWRAIVREDETQRELEDIRQRLAEVESQAKIDKRRLERELERLKEELNEKGRT